MFTSQPALLLDMDGTVRKPKTGSQSVFIESADDIMLIEGMEERIMAFKTAGYLIIGISNQGGISHGYKTVEQIQAELAATHALFKQPVFNLMLMCPHMNGGSVFPYNKRSLCRKPDYGMLVIAEQKMLEEHSVMIDWPFSILVGDREEDKLCANNANITFCDAKLFRRWEVGFVPTKFNVNLPVALPGEGSFYDRLEQVDDNLEKEK